MTSLLPFFFASALLLSVFLTRLVRNLAVARGWVVPASSERHVHRVAVPRLGGVAVYVTLCLVLGSYAAVCYIWHVRPVFSLSRLGVMAVPATLVFLVGLADDIWQLRAHLKFFVEAVAAAILFFGGIRVEAFTAIGHGWRIGALPSFALTLLWVLWITNAFNLIDGLDGLAAGSALFSVFSVTAIAALTHHDMVFNVTICLAGAILGFLRFNFNPATIFLGDSGSLLIGFLLAALSITGTSKASTAVAIGIPLVSFGLPVADTILAVLRRGLSGRPIFSADREHIHHKLLDVGFTHRQVVLVLYGASALFGLSSLILLYPSGLAIGVIMGGLGLTVWLCVSKLGYLEFRELQRLAIRSLDQKAVIRNNLAVHRATMSLRTCTNKVELVGLLDQLFENHEFDEVELSSELLHLYGSYPLYSWLRQSSGFSGLDSCWTLVIELTSARNQCIGELQLRRRRTDVLSNVDLNIFVNGEFPRALAECVQRVWPKPTPEDRHELTPSRAAVSAGGRR